MTASAALILLHFCLLPFEVCLLPSALLAADLAQASDDLLDEPVGRRGPGGDADAPGPAQVFRVDLVRRLDEKTFFALLLADREELQAVRRVAASHDGKCVNVSGPVAPRRGGAVGQLPHLGDERAGRVNHALGAPFQLALPFGRDAVRAYDRGLALGDLFGRVDGADAFGFEPLSLLRVVDEGAERAHACALRERALDHLHGALHAETEPELFSQ